MECDESSRLTLKVSLPRNVRGMSGATDEELLGRILLALLIRSKGEVLVSDAETRVLEGGKWRVLVQRIPAVSGNRMSITSEEATLEDRIPKG